jgi:hydrogenase nickel incorporation protein HypA/HybF
MRAIEPESLRWAWVCATEGTELAGTRLDLEVLPWKLACPACGREFDAETTEAACPSCARPHVRVVGSDELQVVSLTVDDLVAGAV